MQATYTKFISAARLTALHCVAIALSTASYAQPAGEVVPITSEPEHRIRFDNGRVRMYEVKLAKGQTTLWHERRADSYSIIFRPAEITNEPHGGKPAILKIPAGAVGFASVEKGPYTHRIGATSDAGFHVIALEVLSAASPSAQGVAERQGPPFKLVRQSPRGRAYRLTLGPGESTGAFLRPANTAVFAITSGRVSEHADGKPARYWDFETGHFRWLDAGETLRLKNEGTAPVDLVEVEIL
ncbi:MAG: hypothetical protein OEW94_03165 [Betaproteobacteria bacterium]|nr:hypothetical protein [Betaproteobacteria bacterium]